MIEAYGQVSYHDYVFPSTYNIKFNSEIVYNENAVTRKYYQNTITVEFIINSPDTITFTNDAESVDAEMQALRNTLSMPRKTLSFTFQGAGFEKAVTVGARNTAAGNLDYHGDVTGGPIPRIVTWEPIAANKAIRVTWTCEFATATCICDSCSINDLLAVEYNRTFSINEEGHSTITTEGFMEMPHARANSSDLSVVHVDKFREHINYTFPLPPLGFKRTKQNYAHDRTGRKMNFTIVDEEMPSENPLFPYTINIEAEHTASSSLNPQSKLSGGGFMSWSNELSADITIAPGYPKSLADTIFRWILWQRFGIIGGSGRIVNQDDEANSADHQLEDGEAQKAKPKNVLLSYEIKNDIYSRRARFRATYFGVYKLEDLLEQSGIFNPVYTKKDVNGKYPWQSGYLPNRAAEYRAYQGTIFPKIQGPGGFRKAREPFVKILFDPCTRPNGYAIPEVDVTEPFEPDFEGSSVGEELNEDFDTGQESYLKYHNEFYFLESVQSAKIPVQDYDDTVDQYKYTNESDLITPDNQDAYDGFNLHNKYNYSGSPDVTRAVIGVGGGSSYTLVMRGYGVRYGKPVNIPSITQVEGRDAYRIGQPMIAQKMVTEGDTPLYVAKWSIPYAVEREILGPVFSKIKGNAFMYNNIR